MIDTITLTAAVLVFTAVLTVTPVLTLAHLILAIRRRNTPLSRFWLLGLAPSAYFTFILAIPSFFGGWWFPFLRKYWPPLFDLHWLIAMLAELGMIYPAYIALLIFGLELWRGGASSMLIRATVAVTYAGTAIWFYRFFIADG